MHSKILIDEHDKRLSVVFPPCIYIIQTNHDCTIQTRTLECSCIKFMLSRQSAIRLFSKKKTNLKCTPLNTQSVIEMLCKRKGVARNVYVNVYFRIWLMTIIDEKSPRGAQLVSQPSNSMIHCSWPHQAFIKAASHHQPAVAARVIQKMGCLLTATSCLQRINLFQLSSDRTVTLQLLLLTLVSHHHTLLSQNTLFVLLRQLFSSFFLVFYPKQVTKANLLTLLQIDIAVLNKVWSIRLYYFVLRD